MELIFMDELEIDVGTGTQIQLPNYVKKLSVEETYEAQTASDKESRIVAAGTDPKDGKITLLTAIGKVMIFDANKFYIPFGPAIPSHCGKMLHLPNVDGRWPGMEDGCFVDAGWLLQNSVSGLIGATISTNTYRHEDKP